MKCILWTAWAAVFIARVSGQTTVLHPSGGDDTAAITKAFSACSANCAVHLSAGTFKTTGQISIQGSNRSLIGDGRGVTTIDCEPASTINACVQALNTPSFTIADLSITNNNMRATYGLSHELTASSAEFQTVRDVSIGGARYGWAIGPQTGGDLSHVNGHNVAVLGSVLADVVIGNGSQANVLDNACFGCTFDTSREYGVLQRGGGFSMHGGAFDENAGTDWFVSQVSDQPTLILGVRSEGSIQFFHGVGAGNTTSMGSVTIQDCSWMGNASHIAAIDFTNAASIAISNSRFCASSSPVTFKLGNIASNPTHISMNQVGIANRKWAAQLAAWASNPAIVMESRSDYYVGASFVTGTPRR